MGKWLIVSDSHGSLFLLEKIKEKHRDLDGLVYLGDGINELNRYSHGFLQVVSVRGNCDLLSDAPEEMTFNLGGQTVYLSHGHKWGVKSGLMRLFLRAKEAGATVALFGHSHRYTEEFYEGVFFLNPGALVDGSYAVLTLSLDTIKAEQFSLY